MGDDSRYPKPTIKIEVIPGSNNPKWPGRKGVKDGRTDIRRR